MSDNTQPAPLPDLGPGITVLSMDAGPAALHGTIAGALGEIPSLSDALDAGIAQATAMDPPAVPVVHDLGTLGGNMIQPPRVVLNPGMDGLLGRMVAHVATWAEEAERLAQATPTTLADMQAHLASVTAHMGDLAGLLDKVVTFAHGLAHHLDNRGAE